VKRLTVGELSGWCDWRFAAIEVVGFMDRTTGESPVA